MEEQEENVPLIQLQRSQISINTKKKGKPKRTGTDQPFLPPKKKIMPSQILEQKYSQIDITLIERCNGLPKDEKIINNAINQSVMHGPNYDCVSCGNAFFSGMKLKMHLLMEHKTAFCKMCDLLFQSEEEQTDHNSRIHDKVICEICQIEVSNDITEHYEEHHEAVVCRYCDVLLHPAKHYGKHIVEKHCAIEKFLELGDVDAIVQASPKGYSFDCRLCDKTRYRELFGHFSHYHKVNVYYLADIFTKNHIELKQMQLHITDEKKNKLVVKPQSGCKVCNVVPTKEIPLSLHRVYCVGGFPCPFCLKNFDDSAGVETHINENHRQFSCKLDCKLTEFESAEELDDHYITVHSTNRCKLCEEFTNNEMEHMVNIHKVKSAKTFEKLLKCEDDEVSCCLCDAVLPAEHLKDVYYHFKLEHLLLHKKIVYLIGRRPGVKAESESNSDDDSEDSSKQQPGEFRADFDPKFVRCLFILSKLMMDEVTCELCEATCTSELNLVGHFYDKHSFKISEEIVERLKNKGKTFRLVDHLDDYVASEISGYECPKCYFVISSEDARKHILENHNDELEYFDKNELAAKCRFCEKSFWEDDKLEEHELEQHYEQNKTKFLKCNVCSNPFSKLFAVAEHSKISEKCGGYQGIIFQCTTCCIVFPKISDVREHFSASHPKQTIVFCPLEKCAKTFALLKYARQHFKFQHDKKMTSQTFDCDMCGKSFTNKKSFLLHSKNSHAKGFKCVLCGEKFQTAEHRKHHYATIHPGELFYECAECLKTFLSKSGLHVHTKMHKDFSSICPYCGKEFFRRDSYKEHLLIHIGPKHQCPYCSKSFTQKSNLRRHIRLHTGEKPYNCPYCPKKFSDKGACNSHITVHTREDECYCDICGKKFSKQQKLKYHMKRHTGEGLAKCDICHRGFTSQYDLRKHLTTHDQQTQIICQCGRGFASEKYLRTHIKVVHNPNKVNVVPRRSKFNCFQCLVCNNFYSLRTTILKHLRKIHNLEKKQYAKHMRRLEPEEESLFTPIVLEQDVNIADTLKVELRTKNDESVSSNDSNINQDDVDKVNVKVEVVDPTETVYIKQEFVNEEMPSSSTWEDVPTTSSDTGGRARKRKHMNPAKYLGGDVDELH